MINIPVVKLGIVAVSRDCFPIDLSQSRRSAIVKEMKALKKDIVEIETTIENELDAIGKISFNQPKGTLYRTENPFA